MSVQAMKTTERIGPNISWTLGIGLLIAVSIQHMALPITVGYSAVMAVYIAIIGAFVGFSDLVVTAKKLYLGIFLLLVSIAILTTVANPTVGTGIRLVALLFFTTANFFIVPKMIPFRRFLFLTSRTSIVLVLVGLLPYLGFPDQLGIIDISLWGGSVYWYPALEPITSVFDNPNALGFLTLVGAISAFGEWILSRSTVSATVLLIATVGLALTNFRSGWIAFLIAFALFWVYQLGGRDYLVLAVFGGLSFTALLMMLLFGLMPGPTSLTELSLNGRRQLWIASIHALAEKPFLGHGLGYGGTHNSYLRMFAALGVVGGVVYLVFCLATVIRSSLNANSLSDITVLMALMAVFYTQLFNGLSFVGISLPSTLIAVIMGYHITAKVD